MNSKKICSWTRIVFQLQEKQAQSKIARSIDIVSSLDDICVSSSNPLLHFLVSVNFGYLESPAKKSEIVVKDISLIYYCLHGLKSDPLERYLLL